MNILQLSMTMVVYYLHTSPKTNKSISHFLITEKQIIDIFSKLNGNECQGYDHISVAMLQLCLTQVAIPLQIISQKCISSGTFPNFWRYANIQPIHKKRKPSNEKQL